MNGTETPLTKYVISRVFEIIVKVCPVRLASSSGHNLITKKLKNGRAYLDANVGVFIY
jgi:hypothetical protein